MRTYLSLAYKEVKKQKLTTFLIIVAIMMSTAMTTVIGKSIGVMKNLMVEQAHSLNGDRHVTFHELDEQQIEHLKSKEGLSQIGVIKTLGTMNIKDSGISMVVRENDKASIKNYPNVSRVKLGRIPKAAREIALDENTLKLMGISPDIGDKILLDLSVSSLKGSEPPFNFSSEYTLSGILESDYLGYANGIVTAIAGPGTVNDLLPDKYNFASVDFKVSDFRDFQNKINSMASDLNLKEHQIQYNWIYLNTLGIDYKGKDLEDNGAAGIADIAVFMGILVLLAAGLVVYNILKISVVKKIKEYGILRAIGAEPNQLYKIIIVQIFLLCAIAIPMGVVVGVLSANTITAAATSMINPEVFLANSSEQLSELIHENAKGYSTPLLLGTGVSLVFSFLAALPSAIYAAKVSPKIAMAGVSQTIKRKNSKSKEIINIARHLAWLNLKRNRGRTIITILSLFMSITVFVALKSFSSNLDISNAVKDFKMGDFSISNETVGIKKEALKELYQYNNVERVSFVKYSMYTQKQIEQGELTTDISFGNPSETFKIIGIDQQYLKELYPDITARQLADFKSGKLCIIKNPMAISSELKSTSLKQGDRLKINDRELTVQAITGKAVSIQGTGWVNGIDVIVYDNVYDELTGKNSLNQINTYIKDYSKLEEVQSIVERISKDNPGSRWLSYSETDRQMQESFAQTRVLAWGFILFVTLIGVLNIINTTYTNIHTRINEIGMQRAIGMDNKSLYKVFLWEGAYYGILAAISGSIAGYIISIFMSSAATGQIEFSNLPIIPILSGSVLSVAVCLIATVIPLGKIKSMSIVESIDIIS
ncbi:ABC transporter permease [Alkaliphilus serpentinus]|uniref:FtsX-like permease family protein n=1 Tax=Alkaliphilus serpentinus TaxID=1482731 RepID=A0A833M7E2_9FIRM|nr:FtsX-like permease family protein [Alkaliphilus serpentinus]KAB3527450.1 FtsX-like permease family protein [Alkaliphilus serpentinus]